MIIIACIVGVIANFIYLFVQSSDAPEGAMGLGPVFLLAFIPYLLVLVALGMWVHDKIWPQRGGM